MNTVFLDLEKTLIYSWDDPVIINESIIKKTLDAIRPDSIGIYSFAIYDNVDRLHFIESLKQEIESSFQINIDSSLIFTVSEIAIQSFIQDYGKQKSFKLFIHQKFETGNYTLIDDLVENLDLQENPILSIHFLNPFLNLTNKSK